MTEELKHALELQNYYGLREIPGRGICGLQNMMFTVGLCYGINEYSYEGRYCYGSIVTAAVDLQTWDGSGDPPGNWIKHKGETEYSNPNKGK